MTVVGVAVVVACWLCDAAVESWSVRTRIAVRCNSVVAELTASCRSTLLVALTGRGLRARGAAGAAGPCSRYMHVDLRGIVRSTAI
eukprot:SAG31_NODE_39169_length_290_cov_1.068063_1_plen_85_part_10